ncbi:MAG: hypothetical protein ACXAC7_01640 [Candidatus Hodarchaeales archaeon]|jgi:hypothetical protein
MKYKDAVNELKKTIKKNFNREYVSYDRGFETRKKTDILIRGLITSFIEEFMDGISEIQAIALQSQMIMIWSDLDRLMSRLKDLLYLLREEREYQGSTFFISSKKAIDHFEIMVQSELGMLDVCKQLSYRLERYREAVDSALLSDSSKLIGEIMKLLGQISNMWKIRTDTIAQFRFIH